MAALKAMYRDYGERLWGPFGYLDAFNPGQDWYSSIYIAIDQGPIAVMIENTRTQLLWNLFMSNPEIAPALAAMGFVPDYPADAPVDLRPRFDLAAPSPNPSTGSINFVFDIPTAAEVDLAVFDVAGRRVATLVSGTQTAGRHTIQWSARNGRGRLPGGVYFSRLQMAGKVAVKRFVVLD
jgi:hypothetical protein